MGAAPTAAAAEAATAVEATEAPRLPPLSRTPLRDLTKPVGALDEARLAAFLERWRQFEEDEGGGGGDGDALAAMPRFMYGSHYSSPGVVLYFLLRIEPFTSLALELQGGHFDCPDRVFHDAASSWRGCHTSMSDVRELTPEWFCCPEAFVNASALPLGRLQDGRPVGDVRLPPWARGDAHAFVRGQRAALESERASAALPAWIDLVFGAKQRGEAAVAARNVFHFLTCEGARRARRAGRRERVERSPTRARARTARVA